MTNLAIADIYRGPIVKQHHDIEISCVLIFLKLYEEWKRHLPWRTKKNISGRKRICAAFTTAQNIDEYFFTEVKPFLFDSAVRNRALRFTRAKQSLAENYNSFCASLDENRDWMNSQILRIYLIPWKFLHRLQRRSMLLLFLGSSIGPIVSFLETRVVIPADVTHCREKGYHEGRLLQNSSPHGIDSALYVFFFPVRYTLFFHITNQQEIEKQTHSDPLINRVLDCAFLFSAVIFL